MEYINVIENEGAYGIY